MVEIDVETCAPNILKYVVAHDAGILINPKIAEGQILDGVCQGIGGALLEEVVYGDDRQLLTGSLIAYLVPLASDMPPVEIHHTETPSTLNELGIKGLGEGDAVAPRVTIVNAVCDALRPIPAQNSESWRKPRGFCVAVIPS
jgi:aerobic carbon-monoxide dehydrogenase large subunit